MTTDQTPDTGDRVCIHGKVDHLYCRPSALQVQVDTLRQSLTEAEASHQAEIGRLRGERDAAMRNWVHVQDELERVWAERDTLAARLVGQRQATRDVDDLLLEAEKVVEAAVKYRRIYATPLSAETAYVGEWLRELLEAVDAYQSTRAETTDG